MAKGNYSPLEKLALSLVNMTRRLRRYFEAHPVKVITDQPIRNILSRTEVSGKLAKYAVEIGTYKISFIPRNAVKGQVLADFLSDAPDGEREDEYFQSRRVSLQKIVGHRRRGTFTRWGSHSSKGSGSRTSSGKLRSFAKFTWGSCGMHMGPRAGNSWFFPPDTKTSKHSDLPSLAPWSFLSMGKWDYTLVQYSGQSGAKLLVVALITSPKWGRGKAVGQDKGKEIIRFRDGSTYM
ncbi:reverse transcriptase domain-containing protein [Tanacetum coccineum]